MLLLNYTQALFVVACPVSYLLSGTSTRKRICVRDPVGGGGMQAQHCERGRGKEITTGPSNGINMDATFHNGETFEEKLATIASFLASKNNIIVLVGAGISVSCGIPDFRSENGLYNTLNYQVSQKLSSEFLLSILPLIKSMNIRAS